jgi:phosphohistidine phosphatase
MIIYLMRHADAGAYRENPTLDAKRSLVKEGKEQCMLMARPADGPIRRHRAGL